MHTKNLLDANTSRFTSTLLTNVGNWVGTTNSTLTRTTKRYHTGIASAVITHNGTGTTMSAESGSSGAINTLVAINPQHTHGGDDLYRAIVWFHHEIPNRVVRVGVQFYDTTLIAMPYTSAYYVDRAMGFGEWTLAVVDVVKPADAAWASVRIDLNSIDTSNSLDGKVWIDDIGLVEKVEVSNEDFVSRISRWIPAYMLEEDAEQTNPVNPLLMFFDVAGIDLAEIQELITEFGYERVGNSLYPTATSSLVDPSDFPDGGTKEEWLPWIAQLVGLRPSSITESLGSGAWEVLETTYPTWSDWENTLNLAPLSAAVSPTSVARTSGTVAVTKTSHGLVAGDVVNITGATPSNFNGYYEVETATANIFYYSQSYVISSLSRSGTTVTIVCGRPHGLSVGDTVVVTGTGVTAVQGTFTVTAVGVSVAGKSGVDTLTYTTGTSGTVASFTGAVYPSNATATGSSYQVAADLKWTNLESVGFYSLTRAQALAEFIRTGASGVWGGTIEGIKRAARIPLNGVDERCSAIRANGTLTITIPTTAALSVGEWIEVYGTSEPSLNRNYVVGTVSSVAGSTIVTCSAGGTPLDSTIGYVTNRRVEVTRSAWIGTITDIKVESGYCTVNLSSPIPSDLASQVITISGTGNTVLDQTHSAFLVFLYANRTTIMFDLNVANIPLVLPSAGRIKLVTNRHTFVVATLAAQTPRSDVVVEYTQFAKPAGGVVTHEYYTGA